jgi:hypothetical protein
MGSVIQTYLLRTEAVEYREALFTTVKQQKCGGSDWPWHRAEVPLDPDITEFEQARERLLPVKCMYCGKFTFTRENSSMCFSSSDTLYVNPVTKVCGHHLRDVVAPGAMWFCPWLVEEGVASWLSCEYRRDWLGKRPPLCIRLPGGSDWMIDGVAYDNGKPKANGWTITGDNVEALTASPSILTPRYHGWLTNGVLREC